MSSEEDYYYSDEEEYGESDGEDAKDGGSIRRMSSSSRSIVQEDKVSLAQEYECLDLDDLLEAQQKLVDDVGAVLNLDKDKASVLLLHFRWNKERLLEATINDPTGTLEKAGALQKSTKPAPAKSKSVEMVECPIMFDKFPIDETYSMGCTCKEHPEEHRFSILAWQDYLRCKVEDGPDCVFAKCPMDACTCVVSPGTWAYVLSLPSASDPKESSELLGSLDKYHKFLLNSFVDINRNMKWCGTAGCNTAISATGAVTDVICNNCKGTFCFKCGHESHAPISCKALATWLEKCSNESETANWILANTKKCPKCSVRIEKNQGCNHVACRVCKFDFCWVCMGEWSSHSANTGGYYSCNKFKPTSSADDEVSKAKRELDRYLHYYQRYAGHEQALKFAAKQRQATIEKMVKLQGRKRVGWIDVQFLDNAVEQLIKCRRVLKYTYAFAYYLPDGKEKNLFEDSQSVLEQYTEKLSELTEKPLDELDGAEVTNMTRITATFMKNLLTQVENEGMVDLATDGAVGSFQKMTDAEPASVTIASNKKKKTRR